MNSDMTTIF